MATCKKKKNNINFTSPSYFNIPTKKKRRKKKRKKRKTNNKINPIPIKTPSFNNNNNNNKDNNNKIK